jgi:hypothetical protein
VGAADHREHFARHRVDDCGCPVGAAALLSVLLVDVVESVFERFARLDLELKVARRDHGQAKVAEVFAKHLLELGFRLVHEFWREAGVGVLLDEHDGRGERLVGVSLGCPPVLYHLRQDILLPVLPLRKVLRVVGRRLREAGEQAGLEEADIFDVLTEVKTRCFLHAKALVAEVDLVQVEGQDLILIPALLEARGQFPLTHFARVTTVLPVAEPELDYLLRDRRRAALPPPQDVVLETGLDDADSRNPRVVVELIVLSCENRIFRHLRNLREGGDGAALFGEFANQLFPGSFIDPGRDQREPFSDLVDVG